MRLNPAGDPSGGRLRAALALSLVLHGLALAPWRNWQRAAPEPPPPAPLTATLLAPALQTYEEKTEPAAPVEPVAPPAMRPEGVPPASTSGIAAARPQQLQGRRLAAAMAALTQEEFYPREAIARGIEGRVVLLLNVAGDGKVESIEIAGSSGHALLDDAARHAARRIGSVPGGRRQVLLPVEFRLE